MKKNEKISKAIVQLITGHPFFACLAMRMEYVPAAVEKCITDGIKVYYNSDYVDQLPVDVLKGVIAHEVMHLVMLHHTRRNNRDLNKWNKAADYAINPLLTEAGFVLPIEAIADPAYEGMTAEQIFRMLPEPNPGGKETHGGNEPGVGDIQDPPPQSNIQEMEADMKQAVLQAAMMARRAGQLPDGMERLIEEMLEPKIDWRSVLARFITELTNNDYTWTKPNRRYAHMGLYLPTNESEEIGQIILMVDTSGSIDEKLINQFAGEAKCITDVFDIDLFVMYVDAVIKGVQYIERGQVIHLEPKGGGGTDFRPGFDYIEENDLHPKAVVYLTDGRCNRFPEPPEYAVLWALFSDVEFNPPFGEVLTIE
jgi:predicted metal-dependent peptidase